MDWSRLGTMSMTSIRGIKSVLRRTSGMIFLVFQKCPFLSDQFSDIPELYNSGIRELVDQSALRRAQFSYSRIVQFLYIPCIYVKKWISNNISKISIYNFYGIPSYTTSDTPMILLDRCIVSTARRAQENRTSFCGSLSRPSSRRADSTVVHVTTGVSLLCLFWYLFLTC